MSVSLLQPNREHPLHNWAHALLQGTLTFFRLSTQATHLHVSLWFTCTSICVSFQFTHCAHCQFLYNPICFPWKSYIASPQRCSLVHVPPDLTLAHRCSPGPSSHVPAATAGTKQGFHRALCQTAPQLLISPFPGPPQAQLGTSRNLPLYL